MPSSTVSTGWDYNRIGLALLPLVSLLALVLCLFNYFNSGNGIHGTEGALLVVVSSALMLIASGAIALGRVRRGWLHVVLQVLIFLDILGTAAAGYFLESWTLVGLMVVALIAWIAGIVRPSSPAVTAEVA